MQPTVLRDVERARPSPAPAGREIAGPHFDALPRGAHLLEPIITRAHRDPTAAVAAIRDGDRVVDVTAKELLDRVRELAKGLIACGVVPGDRVVLMSSTRLEWVLLDYAILATGAVTVPVYETSSAVQLRHIVTQTTPTVTLVETAAMRALVRQSAGTVGSLADPLVVGPIVVEPIVVDEGGLDVLATAGRDVSDEVLDRRIDVLTTDTVATVVYTSGTTGDPKGCVLTHGNLRANAHQSIDAVRDLLVADERSLLFLPLAHAFARTIAFVGAEHGVKATFAGSVATLTDDLRASEPTMIVAVPRVFEKAFEAARHRARARRTGMLFTTATDVAIRYSRQRASGRVTRATRALHAVFERLVYSRLRHAFGGSLRLAFSGASALSEDLTHFFDGAGIRIFEGYGLTEAGPVLTVNRADAWRPGTVGHPVAGTRLRLDHDGEILAAGPQIFRGYWQDEAATEATFTPDGWLRTGDVGGFDDGGFVRITGRKKDLIVTAGGKNVAPAPMEEELRAHPMISEAVVVGDGRPFVAALVTVDATAFASWRAASAFPERSVAESVDDFELRAVIQHAVDDVNHRRSRAERIRSFAILPEDFSGATGELTPTLKVRRRVIEDRYADVIEGLYAS
jgi:long-chain acyl-CoA synthetase